MRGGGRPLLARWTSDFDCGYETEWWYCIKDTPYDISKLDSKRRYEINKGRRNFFTKQINPSQFKKEIADVMIAAFSAYPEEYRPKKTKEQYCESIKDWNATIIGCFCRESERLVGFCYSTEKGLCIYFSMMKTMPQYEKLAVNAALVDGLLVYYRDSLQAGSYICDGERNILHKTNFQDYLEKYFGFRKAYCQLHVVYRKPLGAMISILYNARKWFYQHDDKKLLCKVAAVLKMEEIVRTFGNVE